MTESRVTGIVADIQRYSIQDGPGIRTTVFLKGCPLRCGWCSNPETQRMEPELMINGETGKQITVGTEMTVEQVMDLVRRDRPFYDGSQGGVTLSGGEVLLQPEFAAGILRAAKEEGIHTAIMTSGYGEPSLAWQVFEQSDLILFDLKAMNEENHKKNTGVSLKPIHENLERLLTEGKRVIARVPVIPNHNDNREELQAIVNYASSLGVTLMEFLPYHRLGESKYQNLHREYPWKGVSLMHLDALRTLVDALQAPGKIKLCVVN